MYLTRLKASFVGDIRTLYLIYIPRTVFRPSAIVLRLHFVSVFICILAFVLILKFYLHHLYLYQCLHTHLFFLYVFHLLPNPLYRIVQQNPPTIHPRRLFLYRSDLR